MAAARRLISNVRNLRRWIQLPDVARDGAVRDRGGLNADPGIELCVSTTTDWLCRAQSCSISGDGGVARHFSLVDGWGPSYPETTGYIVPTLLEAARRTGRRKYEVSAQDMLDWLIAIQLPGGGFQGGTVLDTPVVPVVFNTGQILIGLAAGAREFGEPYMSAAEKAASWLADCQDQDGAWRRNGSPFAKAGDKTYDTHVAWGLLEAARACNSDRFADAGLKNVRWAMSRIHDNGWFADCCLSHPGEPLTHTIGYALRGVLEGYLFSSDQEMLDAAIVSGTGLLQTQRRDGSLPGRIDSRLNAAAEWACLTGNVQIAYCWLKLYELTGERKFLDAGRVANRYVRRTVDVSGKPETRGAVRGSFPINGDYGPYKYLNWAAKFFVDSNVLEKGLLEAEK